MDYLFYFGATPARGSTAIAVSKVEILIHYKANYSSHYLPEAASLFWPPRAPIPSRSSPAWR